jgi:proline racemase
MEYPRKCGISLEDAGKQCPCASAEVASCLGWTGRLLEEPQIGPYRAVVPTIGGRAWIAGFSNYVLGDAVPFPQGFTLSDIW